MHRTLVTIASLIAALLSTSVAHGGSPGLLSGERPLWTGVGLSGGGTAEEVGGVGHLSVTLGLRLIPVVPELTLREGLASNPRRHVTGIAAGARFLFPEVGPVRPFARVMFAHQHELQGDLFVDMPWRALVGIHYAMTHRTGVEAGGGIEIPFGGRRHFGAYVQATAVVLPATQGPDLYVLGEAGVSFAFGPRLPDPA